MLISNLLWKVFALLGALLSTDYPPLKENEGLAVFAFPDGKTLRPAK